MIDRPFRLTDRRKMNASFVMEHLVCRLKQQFLERMNETLMNEESLSVSESEDTEVQNIGLGVTDVQTGCEKDYKL